MATTPPLIEDLETPPRALLARAVSWRAVWLALDAVATGAFLLYALT